MVLKAYSVYDAKVQLYTKPFFLRTKGEALRSWIDTANDPESEIYVHAEDYTLFELGEYDEESGQLENHPAPISVGCALEYRKPNLKPIHGQLES